MVSIIYYLNKHPKILENLRTQLQTKTPLTIESIDEVDYLKYIVKEAQRIDGSINTNLQYKVFEDFECDGIHFKKGTILFYNLSAIH